MLLVESETRKEGGVRELQTSFNHGYITGQDGSYLAELLLENGYEVFGVVRRTSNANFKRINHIKNRLTLLNGDVTDYDSLRQAFRISDPREVYHLAAQSHVGDSFEMSEYTTDVIVKGTLNMLNCLTEHPKARMYHASSSEMYGNSYPVMIPVSPYGCAKLHAHNLCKMFREAYGTWVSCGIMFNHESPRRGEHFVTRKITMAAAKKEPVKLYNVDAKRDWGHARDYVRAMALMLRYKEPRDFTIATGERHSVRDFARLAYEYVGLDYKDYLIIDDKFKRPIDIESLKGNPSEAKNKLFWKQETSFRELVKEMMDEDTRQVLQQ